MRTNPPLPTRTWQACSGATHRLQWGILSGMVTPPSCCAFCRVSAAFAYRVSGFAHVAPCVGNGSGFGVLPPAKMHAVLWRVLR